MTAVRRGGGKDFAGAFGGLCHQTASLDRDAERLFAQDVQTGLHAVQGDDMMQTMRQAQVHSVDLRLSEQFLMLQVDSGPDAEQLLQHVGPLYCSLLVGITHGGNDEIAAPALLQILHREHMASRDFPATDQSELNRHQRILTGLGIAANRGDGAGKRLQAGRSSFPCIVTRSVWGRKLMRREGLPNQPLMPVNAMPCTKVFCRKKKSRKMGIVINTEAAS